MKFVDRENEATGATVSQATGKGFAISYCLGPDLISNQVEETALIIEGKFFILDGDWRETYKELGALEACRAFFEAKRTTFGSIWSN